RPDPSAALPRRGGGGVLYRPCPGRHRGLPGKHRIVLIPSLAGGGRRAPAPLCAPPRFRPARIAYNRGGRRSLAAAPARRAHRHAIAVRAPPDAAAALVWTVVARHGVAGARRMPRLVDRQWLR